MSYPYKKSASHKRSFQKYSNLLLASTTLVVFSISSSVFSQTNPGAIEPIITEQERLEPAPSVIETVEPSTPASVSESSNDEIKIPLDTIGLSYFPQKHGLSNDVVDSLEAKVRNFVGLNDGRYSLEQLNQFASELTSLLRDKGYALSNVFVPAQRVAQGSVVLQVVPGLLSKVDAVDSRLYSVKQLESVFGRHVERPVNTNQFEQKLLLINDLPGLSARGAFAAADRTGFTNMRLVLEEQDKVEFRVRLDNYNVESTGDLRFLAGASVNNVTGNRDRLDVDFVQTFDEGDLTNASVQYQIVSPNLRHRFGGRYSQSDYDTESASFEVEGDNRFGELFWRAAWLRSSALNISTRASLAVKKAEQTTTDQEDELTVLGLSLDGDNVDRRFNGLNGVSVAYYRGLNNTIGSLGSRGAADSLRAGISGEFEKWLVNLQRVQLLGRANRLHFRVAGQFTNDQLSSLEQVNLGGPFSVRAFALGIASGDRSKFASAEWRSDWFPFANSAAYGEYTWKEILDVSLFVDYGKVTGVGIDNDEEGAGAGLAISASDPGRRWRAELSAAVPFQDEDQFGRELDDEQIWFSLSGFF